MENSYLDQEKAIREVGRGYDILKQLQVLLQLKSRNEEEAVYTHKLAEPLFTDALQALNYALCIMRSSLSKDTGVKSEIVVLESGSPAYSSHESAVSYDSNQRTANERGKKRRMGGNSWTEETAMPYDDGYQWRKYGDKKINGTNFSRGYYRCTYKEQGCEAKKVVQQISNTEPHLFKVIYTNTHTCSFHKTISPFSTPQPSPFCTPQPSPLCSIEQESGINQMLHLQEYKPSMPKLSDQGSDSIDAILTETFTCASMDERNCEWDLDSLLGDLIGFASVDFPLI